MLPKSRILLFQVLIPYLNFFFLFYYFTTVVIQFQDKFRPVEYCMFEVLVERNRIMRTSIDTELAEHTGTQVIFIGCQDFLFLAIGRPKFVGPDMVKPGAVIVDVGINRTPEGLCGDADFAALQEVASAVTPVPGGVGPMTIAQLMLNTLHAYKNAGC